MFLWTSSKQLNQNYVFLAILCDLFGMIMWPFQRLRIDLQLRDQKVTLNQLVFFQCFVQTRLLVLHIWTVSCPWEVSWHAKYCPSLTKSSRKTQGLFLGDGTPAWGNDPIFDISNFSQLDRSFMFERFTIGYRCWFHLLFGKWKYPKP